MINKLPIIGWLLSFVASVSLSIPFWICWTHYGIGAKYFYWLPEVYQHIPFWNCVGLFIVLSIIKGLAKSIYDQRSKIDNWLLVASLFTVLKMKEARCPAGYLARLNPRILFK